MKHCIIVKYKEDVTNERKKALVPEIRELFQHTTEIDGIYGVKLYENCIDRKNRYDLMIEITMEKEALPVYDDCEWHHIWKEQYGTLLESKAIFDWE